MNVSPGKREEEGEDPMELSSQPNEGSSPITYEEQQAQVQRIMDTTDIADLMTNDALIAVLERATLMALVKASKSTKTLRFYALGEMSRRLDLFFRERANRIVLLPQEQAEMEQSCRDFLATGTATDWRKRSFAQYLAFLLCVGATAFAEGREDLARTVALLYVDGVLHLLQGESHRIFMYMYQIQPPSLASNRIQRVRFRRLQVYGREDVADPDDTGFIPDAPSELLGYQEEEGDPRSGLDVAYFYDDRYYTDINSRLAEPCSPLQHEEARDGLRAAFSPYTLLQDFYGILPQGLRFGTGKWSNHWLDRQGNEVVQLTGGQLTLFQSWPLKILQPVVLDKALTRMDPALANALRFSGWEANLLQLNVFGRVWVMAHPPGLVHAVDPDVRVDVATELCRTASERRLAQVKEKTLLLPSPTSTIKFNPEDYVHAQFADEYILAITSVEPARPMRPSPLYCMACVRAGKRETVWIPNMIKLGTSQTEHVIARGKSAWAAMALAGCDPLFVELSTADRFGSPYRTVGQFRVFFGIPLQNTLPAFIYVAHALLSHRRTALVQSQTLSAEPFTYPGYTPLGLQLMRKEKLRPDDLGLFVHVLVRAGHFVPEAGSDQRLRQVAVTPSGASPEGDAVMDRLVNRYGYRQSISAILLAMEVWLDEPDPDGSGWDGVLTALAIMVRAAGRGTSDVQFELARAISQSYELIGYLILLRVNGGEELYRQDERVLARLEAWNDWWGRWREMMRSRDLGIEDEIQELTRYIGEEYRHTPDTGIDRLETTLKTRYPSVYTEVVTDRYPALFSPTLPSSLFDVPLHFDEMEAYYAAYPEVYEV